MLKRIDFLVLFLFSFLFFVISYLSYPSSFKYRFSEDLIKDYLRSQDIEDKEDKIKDRIFISDDKIYLASGVLYARGEPPAKFNFQHPPFLKYLFGYSVLLFGSPYPILYLFSLIFIFLVYLLGILVFKSRLVSFLALVLIFLDPVFWETSQSTLLDMGQVVFALLFLILFFYYPEKIFLQGVSLGLLFASKFWSVSLLFVFFLVFYKVFFLKSKVNFKKMAFVFGIGFIVFCLSYFSILFVGRGILDIILLQLRTLKFMLYHNNAGTFGNLFMLFISGNYFSWWGKEIIKSSVFSILWPLSFAVNMILVFKFYKNKKIWLIFLVPVFYFLVNLTNTAFTRYFLFILPFLYTSLSFWIFSKYKNKL
jgi:predicted membrane-bound dolichyl-phosphate-mannose-protein mannosyltransferase